MWCASPPSSYTDTMVDTLGPMDLSNEDERNQLFDTKYTPARGQYGVAQMLGTLHMVVMMMVQAVHQ